MNISVPDSDCEVISEAKKNRRSLNAETVQALETEAERRTQLLKLKRQLKAFASSLPALDNSAPSVSSRS